MFALRRKNSSQFLCLSKDVEQLDKEADKMFLAWEARKPKSVEVTKEDFYASYERVELNVRKI